MCFPVTKNQTHCPAWTNKNSAHISSDFNIFNISDKHITQTHNTLKNILISSIFTSKGEMCFHIPTEQRTFHAEFPKSQCLLHKCSDFTVLTLFVEQHFLVRVHLERKRYSLCMCGRHSELESWMNGNDSSGQVKILDTEEASILNHFLECFLWKTYSIIEVSHNSFSYDTENGLFHSLL